MLTLQRASAGSGKTYTLAKKFIWFLISIVPEGKNQRRLRTDRELTDSLSHILAVTFTNKATNEMKQRIVDKIAALAHACDPNPDGTPSDPLKADYMHDFCKGLGETPKRISHACDVALKVMLNDYGDFHVSTIDSFFQTVLRTFAYETELNDSYELELDSKYVARMGMDALLDEIDTPSPSEETSFWLSHIMESEAEAGKKWNVFQRTVSGKSVYSTLINVVTRMEKEDFKMIRIALDEYFERTPDLRNVFVTLSNRYESPVRRLHKELQEAAAAVKSLFAESGLDMKEHGHKFLRGHVEKSLTGHWTGPSDLNKGDFVPLKLSKTVRAIEKKNHPELLDSPFETKLNSLLHKMYDIHDEWLRTLAAPDMRLWMLYRRNLPYVGLLQGVRQHIREFLEENNTVELGETNSMLRRIIGPDDTPFIYERIGTRLNHFLIDEFQDTSRLQWENLHPLLSESEARGHDNLIIGDAKQSIYRFRNADPSLITTVVPGAFPGHEAAGMTPAENTNWRSDLRVVRFNNFIFASLADALDRERLKSQEKGTGSAPDSDSAGDGVSDTAPGLYDMRTLYANTVQLSHHRAEQGYVEVNLFSSALDGNDDNDKGYPPRLWEMCRLVTELRERGYRQKDIAFLVNTHIQEEEVIKAFIDYNDNLPEGARPIEFISEQSLRLGASEAVQLVIAALETVCSGTSPEIRKYDERRRKGVADWERIRCNFNFFAMRHPDLPPSRQLLEFIMSTESDDALSDMLASMQAVALPALVEAVVERFVPSALRDADAPYLAALQDAVADYCQGYPSDIASFLDWWGRKGCEISISSPEDTDAVRVMTIHKSKGLEFGCVILPCAKQRFSPIFSEAEWKWVEPVLNCDDVELPPYLPVNTASDLEESPHKDVLDRFRYLYRMDKLNSVYVAFTRAVHELYIYAPVSITKKDPDKLNNNDSIGYWLNELCSKANELTAGPDGEMPEQDELVTGQKKWQFVYGKKLDLTSQRGPETEVTDEEDNTIINGYFVNSSQPLLHFTDTDVPEPEPDSEDPDPRSEGNVLHTAMSYIRTPEDVRRAVRRLHVKGLVPHTAMEGLEKFLSDAINSVSDRGWFTPSWRVANERAILATGKSDRRPDRLMISADGRTAIVVDYKFGAHHTDNRYRNQVASYVTALQKTGQFDTVIGYLWYVRAGIIEQV